MAPSVIAKNNLNLISNYTPEEFAKAPKLVEDSAIVKQAQKGGYVYLKIGWLKEANSKPIDAQKAFELMDQVIMGFENLPRARQAKRITLDAKVSKVPGKTTREGWIAFPVKGELQEARAQASCFTQMLKRRLGTAVEVKGDNFREPLKVLYPAEKDVQK